MGKDENMFGDVIAETEAYAAGLAPAPVRADRMNRYSVLVHAMSLPGDYGIAVQRRRTRKATKQPRKTKTAILHADNLLPNLEQTEVLAAMCGLLLGDPRENVTLHIERPSTYDAWANLMHGGTFRSNEPVVAEILRRSRVYLRGVWVTTDVGSRSAWDTAAVENDVVERMWSTVSRTDSLLTYAQDCWAEHVRQNIWLTQCRCGKLNYSGHEVRAVMLRAKSGNWVGDTPPARGFYRCPTGSGFHATTKSVKTKPDWDAGRRRKGYKGDA